MKAADKVPAAAWKFSAADAALPGTVPVDLTAYAAALEARLAALLDAPLSVRLGLPRARGVSHAFAADDIGTVLLSVPAALAAALVSRRHGGPFQSDAAASRARSVLQCADELAAMLVAVAHVTWPALASARAVPSPPLPVALAELSVAVGEAAFEIGIAVVLHSAGGAAAGFGAAMDRAIRGISLPIGAQLFETQVSLAVLGRLQAGELLPMATPQVARLRAGGTVVAFATVATAADCAARLTICASAQRPENDA